MKIKYLFFCFLFLLPEFGFSQYKVVFLGDSITEGYGISEDQAYPAVIAQKFKSEGINDVEIINAGSGGSTTASAFGRMKWLLKSKPDLVFLALGGNDGLRGIQVASIEKNLLRAIKLAKQKDLKIIMAGMQMPPNYGQDYTRAFREIFFKISEMTQIEIVPFLLGKVAGEPSLNQADGIHPNPDGQQIIANIVYPYIKKSYVADRR